MNTMCRIVDSRNIVVMTMILSGFVLALYGKDLPPNITRLADVALGGFLGLAMPHATKDRTSDPK